MRFLACGLLTLWIGCGRLNIDPLADVALSDAADPDAPSTAWWNTAWGHRMKLTIDNTGGPALTDFPLLVRLDSTRFDYALAGVSGQDVRFVDPDGTALVFDDEQWGSGQSFVWVNVPQIDADSASDYVWLYFDNPGATPAPNPGATWAGNALVWHLRDVPTGAGVDTIDSTGNSNAGSTQGAMGAGQQNSGVIAGSLGFDGTDDWITAPGGTSLRIVGDLTIQMWIQIAASRDQWLCDYVVPESEQEINNHLYELVLRASNRVVLEWEYGAGTGDGASSTVTLATGLNTWVLVTVTRDIVNREVRFYENGLPLGTPGAYTNDATGGTASSFFLAGEVDATTSKLPLAGRMDEVRIRNDVRSPDWIRADYRSMTDAMLTYGALESL